VNTDNIPFNLEQIRKEMPHYGDKIFFNSAGSSIMPTSVVQRIHAYLREEEEFGGYQVTYLRKTDLEQLYTEAAQLLNCHPRNISFAHDATDAYTKALSSIHFLKGDVIITTDNDYASNHIHFLSLKKRYGIEIVRANSLENGDLDLEDFAQKVEQYGPKLVSVTHVPTNSGLIQDVGKVGEICATKGIIYIVDACQSVGQLVVDVKQIQCDFLSATGRKFLRGPRGTGFLYVSDRMLDAGYTPMVLDGQGAFWKEETLIEPQPTARRFETFEAPFAMVAGLIEALCYVNKMGVGNIQSYNAQLMALLKNQLKSIKGVELYDLGTKQCNILTFRKGGRSLEETQKILDSHNIFYSVSEKHWGLIDFNKKGIEWAIRLSPHYFNTKEEVERVVEIVESF